MGLGASPLFCSPLAKHLFNPSGLLSNAQKLSFCGGLDRPQREEYNSDVNLGKLFCDGSLQSQQKQRRKNRAATPASKSAAIRARLNHPVIDSDGHTVEFLPAVLDYLEQTGGTKVVEWFKAGAMGGGIFGPWYRLSPEERRERRATRPPW